MCLLSVDVSFQTFFGHKCNSFYFRVRLKQNLYPVFLLCQGNTPTYPPYMDLRTWKMLLSYNYCQCEKLLVIRNFPFCPEWGFLMKKITGQGEHSLNKIMHILKSGISFALWTLEDLWRRKPSKVFSLCLGKKPTVHSSKSVTCAVLQHIYNQTFYRW